MTYSPMIICPHCYDGRLIVKKVMKKVWVCKCLNCKRITKIPAEGQK